MDAREEHRGSAWFQNTKREHAKWLYTSFNKITGTHCGSKRRTISHKMLTAAAHAHAHVSVHVGSCTPLQQILMVPSGARTITLIRWRSLENSITSRVSYCTSSPRILRIVCVDVRRTNSNPRVRAHSTSATSSGDGPCIACQSEHVTRQTATHYIHS